MGLARCAAVAAALIAAVGGVRAGNTGSLRIEVTDTGGRPLASAHIAVSDPANDTFHIEGETDAKGRVDLLGLPPRPYVFVVSLAGFVPYESNFLAAAGLRTDRKVRLTTLEEATARPPGAKGEGPDREERTTEAYNEAVTHYKAGRMNEALGSLEIALQAHSDDPASLALKGLILAESGRCEEARPALEKAASERPPRREALEPLARCLDGLGLEGEAAKYRALLESLGRTPADLYNQAVSRINEGNDAAAAPLLEEALRLAEGFAPARYQLGLIQMRRGETSAAVFSLKSYLALAPGGEFAEDARALVAALEPE